MKPALIFLLIIIVSCNNAADKNTPVVKDSVINTKPVNTTSSYIHAFEDTVLETKITNALMKLSFVINSDNYIDSLSNHKQGIAFMMDKAEAGETEVQVQAGYNRPDRFETYYRFFINPKTLQIKVYDAVEDKKLTIKEYLKTQQ